MPRKKKEVSQTAPEETVQEQPQEEVVREEAPEPKAPPQREPEPPAAPSVEMLVESPVILTHVYPQIRVGVCEFHGTPYGNVDMDTLRGRCWHSCKNDPLCPHSRTGCQYDQSGVQYESWVANGNYCRHEHNYKGLPLRCTYCPLDTDMRGVVKTRTLYVYQSPQDPSKLIMVCSDYRCRTKHEQRFNQKVV